MAWRTSQLQISNPKYLHSSPLGRLASVVRDRRDVADRLHFDAHGLQRTNGRLAPRTRSLDLHVDAAQAIRLRRVAGVDRRLRRRERRALARALEADAPGARPRDHVAFLIGN